LKQTEIHFLHRLNDGSADLLVLSGVGDHERCS
jgi:hypothetical protein